MIESTFDKAIEFGREKHKGQKDDEGNDYFNAHCLQVFRILSDLIEDNNTLIASILHDTLEDTETTYEELVNEFGNNVAYLVAEVTHEGKADEKGFYFPILESKEAIIIKFADRLSNLSRMNGWDKKRQEHYLNKSKFWRTKHST